jgi:PAS domain S-box-containing protein
MPDTASQLLNNAPVFHVRDAALSAADGPQSQRDKLARVVLDGMSQFVGLLDPDGNVIEINRAALESAGIRLDGIRGRPFGEVHWWGVSEEARILERDCVRRARGGELARCGLEIQGPAQGEEIIFIDFSVSPVRDDNGGIRFLLVEGRNISGRKRTEAKIAERTCERDELKKDLLAGVIYEPRTAPMELATGGDLTPRKGPEMSAVQPIAEEITQHKPVEERLREYEVLVEALQEKIVVIDRAYRFRIANRAYRAYRGLEKEQLIGKSLADTLGAGPFEEIPKPKLDEAFRGNAVQYEYRCACSGSERDFLVSNIPIEGANGIDLVAIILQDITEGKAAEAALRTLSGRLLRLQDEERRRLARELHDTTAQWLAALSMNLCVLSESADVLNLRAQAAMAESVALADQCLREIRTVSYLLHPRELDDLGLESALSRYTDGFVQRSGFGVELEVSPGLGRLPEAVETAVFRIVQECLTNVHRHSGSSTARVCLIRTPANLVLEVEDSGRGMGHDAASGVGIAGMRERVKQLHGRLEISSHSGGTSVKATIPLPGSE